MFCEDIKPTESSNIRLFLQRNIPRSHLTITSMRVHATFLFEMLHIRRKHFSDWVKTYYKKGNCFLFEICQAYFIPSWDIKIILKSHTKGWDNKLLLPS